MQMWTVLRPGSFIYYSQDSVTCRVPAQLHFQTPHLTFVEDKGEGDCPALYCFIQTRQLEKLDSWAPADNRFWFSWSWFECCWESPRLKWLKVTGLREDVHTPCVGPQVCTFRELSFLLGLLLFLASWWVTLHVGKCVPCWDVPGVTLSFPHFAPCGICLVILGFIMAYVLVVYQSIC